MIKNCYTYYEKIDLIENDPSRNHSQWDLINLCAESWRKHGWNLIVISEEHATSHPFYEQYKNFVLRLPTVNPSNYDYHCFMRWLAMANLGGGIMIDYDVLNLGLEDHKFFEHPELTVYQGHIPCVVSGTSKQYLDIAIRFSELENCDECFEFYNDKKHTSDMLMLVTGKVPFKKLNLVALFPEVSELVHVSYNSTQNKTKFEAMKSLMGY